nr:hypothetical protein CFP56_70580 [Quercus suber]
MKRSTSEAVYLSARQQMIPAWTDEGITPFHQQPFQIMILKTYRSLTKRMRLSRASFGSGSAESCAMQSGSSANKRSVTGLVAGAARLARSLALW